MQWRTRPAVRYVIGSASHSLLMCRYPLGGEAGGEETTASAAAADFQTEGHAHEEDIDADDVDQYNGDTYPDNILPLCNGIRNGEGPPTLVFPNLGPLPIVGFSSQPPPVAGPPLVTLPATHNVEEACEFNGVGVDEDGNQQDGIYVNGLWIPKSELFKQYGGRNPPCLVYHPIPWIRVRSTGSISRCPPPSDAHYRLYFSRRPQTHRGSWRSMRHASQQSLSPYLWCLSPPPQTASPPVFDDKIPALHHQEHDVQLGAPPDDVNAHSPMCQASSSYVYPGYSFGPPVFTAPVLPLQSSVASKAVRPVASPPVPPETPASPALPPDTTVSPKKKKKRRTKSREAMDCTSTEAPVLTPSQKDSNEQVMCTSPGMVQTSESIVHFVDAFLQSTLCQAQKQLQQLKHDRLANGYRGECLASLRRNNLTSPNRDTSPKSPKNSDKLAVSIVQSANEIRSVSRTPSPSQNCMETSVSPALSPNTIAIVFTADGEPGDVTVEAYSDQVVQSILLDVNVNQPPHVVASRSQLFLEGLENSYPDVNHIEQFSSQLVELVIREAYQNLALVSVNEQSSSLESGVFIGFAEELLQNIFKSAREEFHVSQNSLRDRELTVSSTKIEESQDLVPNNVSSSQEESSQPLNSESKDITSKPKTLVHFLEQGFHAPSSETFDNEHFHEEDELDDYVSRERYMEGDPALSHLNLLNQNEGITTDSDQELYSLQDKMRLTNQSIYKISYDEISYTDQSEGEDLEPVKSRPTSCEREPARFKPLRIVENYLRNEIQVHEAETASEAGSEDIELIPHRYESSSTTSNAQEKHLYVNKLSLATELLRTHENLPYDDDFKRIIEEDLNAEVGTVNLGFVCDETKVITTGPKAVSRISAADSGVQSEESDDDVDLVKKVSTTSSNQVNARSPDENEDEDVEVWVNNEESNGRPTCRRPQPTLIPGAPIPPWCSLCCNVQ